MDSRLGKLRETLGAAVEGMSSEQCISRVSGVRQRCWNIFILATSERSTDSRES